MINRCTFIGNVGADPEVRMAGDAKVANFKIACTENWRDKAGEKQSSTEWIPIVAWRQLAEITEKYVTKGQQVYVEGKMKTRSYDKEGVKHFMTEIHIDTLKLLGARRDSDTSQSQAPTPTPKQDPAPGRQRNHPPVDNWTNAPEEGPDDLPF